MMSRLNRCKTISDFNCIANLGILVVICKHFNIFLSSAFVFIVTNQVRKRHKGVIITAALL